MLSCFLSLEKKEKKKHMQFLASWKLRRLNCQRYKLHLFFPLSFFLYLFIYNIYPSLESITSGLKLHPASFPSRMSASETFEWTCRRLVGGIQVGGKGGGEGIALICVIKRRDFSAQYRWLPDIRALCVHTCGLDRYLFWIFRVYSCRYYRQFFALCVIGIKANSGCPSCIHIPYISSLSVGLHCPRTRINVLSRNATFHHVPVIFESFHFFFPFSFALFSRRRETTSRKLTGGFEGPTDVLHLAVST